MTRPFNQGYTLIELVTVILMLAVLSVYALPRLSGAETFSVLSARDSALSVARQVQLRAMQLESPTPNKCNLLNVTTKTLGVSSDPACGVKDNRSDILDLSQSSVQISNPKVIQFDLLGRPFAVGQIVGGKGTRLCVDADCKFTFSEGNAVASICLNSEGYFYACS